MSKFQNHSILVGLNTDLVAHIYLCRERMAQALDRTTPAPFLE